MKVLKIVLLVVWAFITFGLIIYSQSLRADAMRKDILYKQTREISNEMSKGLDEYYENMKLLRNDSLNIVDIDSLFDNSYFLTNYEKLINKN